MAPQRDMHFGGHHPSQQRFYIAFLSINFMVNLQLIVVVNNNVKGNCSPSQHVILFEIAVL